MQGFQVNVRRVQRTGREPTSRLTMWSKILSVSFLIFVSVLFIRSQLRTHEASPTDASSDRTTLTTNDYSTSTTADLPLITRPVAQTVDDFLNEDTSCSESTTELGVCLTAVGTRQGMLYVRYETLDFTPASEHFGYHIHVFLETPDILSNLDLAGGEASSLWTTAFSSSGTGEKQTAWTVDDAISLHASRICAAIATSESHVVDENSTTCQIIPGTREGES